MNAIIIVTPTIRLSETESTNNYAAQMVRENLLSEGTCVIANYQTQGKGRRGNDWSSERDVNILCTVILKPKFLNVSEQFMLSMAMILALKNAVDTQLGNEKASIKWPNDLIVANRKVAGMLIENTLSGSQIVSSLVGFGINVNQKQFPATHSIFQPGSVSEFSNQEIDKEKLLKNCFEKIQQYYFKLMNFRFSEIEQEYHQSLLFQNQKTRFSFQNEIIEAIFKSVKRNGMAIIETDQGIFEASMDELKFISTV